MTTSPNESAFLSVISWPRTGGAGVAVKNMAAASGVDQHQLRLQSRQHVPSVLGRYAGDAARRAAQALIDMGGDAFAPTMHDIEAVGMTRKVKDISLVADGVQFDLWRGAPETIDPHEIDVIVRGHLSETIVPPTPTNDPLAGSFATGAAAAGLLAWGPGGSYGVAASLYARQQLSDWSVIDQRLVMSHKLDIHVNRPSMSPLVYQIDGDKFGFQILGPRRGSSDKVNIERVSELFTHLNPEIVIDPYFRLWKPPAAVNSMRLPMMQVNNDDPAFAFYSRWAALMYRYVMRDTAPDHGGD